MDKVLSKVLALSLLGGISLLLGTIPLKLGQWFNAEDGKRKHETMFSSMLCFGGGLLISTSILHMLPEVSFQILTHFRHTSRLDYRETKPKVIVAA